MYMQSALRKHYLLMQLTVWEKTSRTYIVNIENSQMAYLGAI